MLCKSKSRLVSVKRELSRVQSCRCLGTVLHLEYSVLQIDQSNLKLAIKNISTFGDTDVFPVPLEVHWFRDQPAEVLSLLNRIRQEEKSAIEWLPLYSSTELVNAGHRGYRKATQIDPLWNALLLAAVIELAPAIENRRANVDNVFSYRFEPNADKGTLFANVGWREFHTAGLHRV